MGGESPPGRSWLALTLRLAELPFCPDGSHLCFPALGSAHCEATVLFLLSSFFKLPCGPHSTIPRASEAPGGAVMLGPGVPNSQKRGVPPQRYGFRGGAVAGGCRFRCSEAPWAAAKGPRRDPIHQPPYRSAPGPGSNRSGVGAGGAHLTEHLL